VFSSPTDLQRQKRNSVHKQCELPKMDEDGSGIVISPYLIFTLLPCSQRPNSPTTYLPFPLDSQPRKLRTSQPSLPLKAPNQQTMYLPTLPFADSQSRKLILHPANSVLPNTPSTIFTFIMIDPAGIIDGTSVSVCQACQKSKLPRQSLANYRWVGLVPLPLQDLTWMGAADCSCPSHRSHRPSSESKHLISLQFEGPCHLQGHNPRVDQL
jgi:hypothetical protein